MRSILTAVAAVVSATQLLAQPQPGLYVVSDQTNQVLRYNGTTGAFEGVFAQGGGLNNPTDLAFSSVPEPPALLALLVVPTVAVCHKYRHRAVRKA